ncbi:MAG: DUF308 domain-containing protein [Schleiferiaceae bacterium]|jgi:uncharacterized membrane protein HdeD (DUF308 family)|nr:DUF308 domain-containing protein [Schleiferiaceae bacterium]MDR9442376.1 DUF308 domain-containing protein [Schleiferiaceae bacterium]
MELLRKNWWILAIQGLLLALLGAGVILLPAFTLQQLILYLGLTLLSFGLIMLIWGWLARRKGGNWFGLLFFGVLQMIVGALIQYDSGKATGVFTLTIGSFAILMGIIQIILGFGHTKSRLLYLLNGLVSIVLGVLILVDPFNAPKTLTYLTGFYSIMLGFFVMYYSFKARKLRSEVTPRRAETAPTHAISEEKPGGTGPTRTESQAPDETPRNEGS